MTINTCYKCGDRYEYDTPRDIEQIVLCDNCCRKEKPMTQRPRNFIMLGDQETINRLNKALSEVSLALWTGSVPKTDKKEEDKKLELQKAKENAKPCPFCGGNDLEFTYTTHYGHGDSTFSHARVMCKSCKGAKGDGSYYGSPTIDDEISAYKQWNIRK